MRAVLVFFQPDLTWIRVEIADNPSSASRSKHIDVKLHFIWGLIRAGKSVVCARWDGGAARWRSYEASLEKEVSGAPCSGDESFPW